MKHFLIVLSALLLAQGHKGENVVSRNPSENGAEELLKPFLQEFIQLKNLIQQIKQHQQTQKISPLSFALPPHFIPPEVAQSLDSDTCNNLTKSLKKAANLAEDIGNWASEAGHTIWEKFTHVMHCGNINPITAFKCVINDIIDLKEFIISCKPDILEFKDEIVALAKELKMDFKECFGLQRPVQAEQMID